MKYKKSTCTPCIKLVSILNEGIYSSIKALRSLVALSYEGEHATASPVHRVSGKSEGKRALQNVEKFITQCTCSPILYLPVLMLLLFGGSQPGFAQNTTLEALFADPPPAARPWGYWVWGHGNFDYRRMTEELEAFKEMGLGGVDIYDMGIADPYDFIPPGNAFLGEEMLDGISYAAREAQRLDLGLGLSVSNGWNAGGDWTEPDEMIMRLLFWKDTLRGPLTLSELGFPEVPRSFEKPYGSYELFPVIDEDGFPEYYEDVALVAYPLSADGVLADPDAVQYFDVDAIEGNAVELQLPAGEWVLARAVVTPLGQRMWMRSDRSNGFIMDHYSRKATRHHFEHVISKLQERLGDLGRSALQRLYLASFEAEDYIIWSPELRETFEAQHGYALDPYIPVFAGQQVIDGPTTERFLHDYRSTVSEMFVNNHYRQARDICHRHGLLLASEAGGPGPPLHYVPTEDLKALGSVDIMRGEFWNMPQHWKDANGNNLLQVVKNIASAAHIYGHSIVEMEAFTSHRKHWQESPLELKRLADRAFCQGMTRVVYHTMPHSPPEAGVPGWSYQAGTHISPKMTWWDFSKPFHAYLARTSALLQQGRFVADVAYYYGESIPNFASGPKYLRPTLGAGYDYDDLNKEVLLQASVTADGRLQLPSGMTYRLLVLPDDPAMSLEVLQKIETLLRQGALILGTRPQRTPGLSNSEEADMRLHTLADKIWGSAGGQQKSTYGRGTLYQGYAEREILNLLGVGPDFQYTAAGKADLDYIHRAIAAEDIYFIRNRDSTAVEVLADFRVSGKRPRFFDPVSGRVTPAAIYTEQDGRTRLPLVLEPLGSVFVVFDAGAAAPHVVAVEQDGRSGFPESAAPGGAFSRRTDDALAFYPAAPGAYRLTFSDGTTGTWNYRGAAHTLEIKDSWDVRFPHGWGFSPLQTFDELQDWTQHPEVDLAHFSGKATYRNAFELDEDQLGDELAWELDLGRVGEVARVYLNGYEVGVSVFPPHRFDVTSRLRPGANHLVVEVANTWLNRMVGDLDKPVGERRTRSNVGEAGGKRPWSDMRPLPSGLMGPVTLRAYPVFHPK